ncbi:hypothetical protein [Kibdelosporangium aridum]|uniref:hypothetical protein n=1 Tax=Kibdelosporangium aridum TaxID=2030 RepID=UPI001F24D22B|nr:hypothetical protein [Kibdelosporangium aridum]
MSLLCFWAALVNRSSTVSAPHCGTNWLRAWLTNWTTSPARPGLGASGWGGGAGCWGCVGDGDGLAELLGGWDGLPDEGGAEELLAGLDVVGDVEPVAPGELDSADSAFAESEGGGSSVCLALSAPS